MYCFVKIVNYKLTSSNESGLVDPWLIGSNFPPSKKKNNYSIKSILITYTNKYILFIPSSYKLPSLQTKAIKW